MSQDKDNVISYIANANIHGNREQLVVNHDTKEYYLCGCYCGDIGHVVDNIKIRRFQEIVKDIEGRHGYVRVDYATTKKWRALGQQ